MNPKNCWNNINFNQMEEKLLTLPVRLKIPIYEYGTERKWHKRKYKHILRGKHDVSILFFDNNLKAVFKPNAPLYMEKSVRAYQFSKFMGFHFVPPTVIRTINGERGTVQLFVEGDSFKKLSKHHTLSFILSLSEFFNLSHLWSHRFKAMAEGKRRPDKYNNIFKNWAINPDKKSDIYIFYFVSGIIDPALTNILISRSCKLPVLIDNDSAEMTWHQLGDWPFIPLPDSYILYGSYRVNHLYNKKNFSINNVEDFQTFPLNKVKSVKTYPLLKLKQQLAGMETNDFYKLKEFAKYMSGNKNIYFVKWKNNYWIKLKFIDYFIYKNPPSIFSRKTLNQLEKLNETVLRNLLLEKDREQRLGWLYRRDVILEEALKMESSLKNKGQ